MGLDMDFSRLDPQDVLDLAIFAEEDARDNYEQIASWMTNHANDEAAAFFERMGRAEQVHCDQLARQRKKLFGDSPPKHSKNIAWEVETPAFDAIAMDMSLRSALEAALGAEIKAHDYYSEALEYVSDATVSGLFEELRRAELEHRRMIERELAKLG